MTPRRVLFLVLASLVVALPPALVVLDRVLEAPEVPPGTPAGAMAAARQVCGSPPFGRPGRITPGPHQFEVHITCTWTRYGRRNFQTSISCAEGGWQGPIGWSNWGSIRPCNQAVIGD